MSLYSMAEAAMPQFQAAVHEAEGYLPYAHLVWAVVVVRAVMAPLKGSAPLFTAAAAAVCGWGGGVALALATGEAPLGHLGKSVWPMVAVAIVLVDEVVLRRALFRLWKAAPRFARTIVVRGARWRALARLTLFRAISISTNSA